jgi:uncharacterized membrane protein
MLSLGFILSFIGAAVALLIGILIYSNISNSITCPAVLVTKNSFGNVTLSTDANASNACNSAKNTAWTVIGILPVALFFALFAIFGAIGGRQ